MIKNMINKTPVFIRQLLFIMVAMIITKMLSSEYNFLTYLLGIITGIGYVIMFNEEIKIKNNN